MVFFYGFIVAYANVEFWFLFFLLINIQGVHKVRVHFKKIITLIVFAIEIICKKDLKEENRYFLRFY